MPDKPLRQRARRDERPPHPNPIRITSRDLDIVRAVYEYRVLTTQQLKALFFPSMHQAYQRLKALYDHGFIDRRFQGAAVDKMNTAMLYVLDKRGAELLRGQLGLAIDWHPTGNEVSTQFLEHLVSINDVRIAVTISCQTKPNFELLHWLGDSELKADYDRVMIRMTTGKHKTISLIPDSYFVLATPLGQSHCFLELDRGTMTVKRFKEKILAYQQYYATGVYQKRYQTRSLRVLTVTTSQIRADNLRLAAEELQVKQRFWFTALEQVYSHAILFDPIWQIATQTGAYSLIDLSSE